MAKKTFYSNIELTDVGIADTAPQGMHMVFAKDDSLWVKNSAEATIMVCNSVLTITAGTGIEVVTTDPDNPIVSIDDDTLASTDSIQDKLDKQVNCTNTGVLSRLFHESDGGGYQMTNAMIHPWRSLAAMRIRTAP
jgi:hypothetical protein